MQSGGSHRHTQIFSWFEIYFSVSHYLLQSLCVLWKTSINSHPSNGIENFLCWLTPLLPPETHRPTRHKVLHQNKQKNYKSLPQSCWQYATAQLMIKVIDLKACTTLRHLSMPIHSVGPDSRTHFNIGFWTLTVYQCRNASTIREHARTFLLAP